MTTRSWARLLASLAVLAVVAAACDDDGGGDGDGGGGDADDTLTIGSLRPETGSLAFLGAPQIEGVNLAIEDINAAGGVLDSDVELLTGDEGDDAARVTESTNRMLGEGADAIVGAAASGQTQEVIQTLSDEEIVECSPSNTSPDFTDQENADFYFRTVPPDNAVAPIIADQVVADGAETVAVVARADDYGEPLGQLTGESLTELGAEVVENFTYDPEAATFDSEVERITAAEPDAVVVISFAEGGPLINGLLETGMTPDQFYGGDGVFGPTFTQEVDPANPNVIDGMTVIGASGNEDFNARLNEALPDDEKGNLIYGGQSYDCAVIIALAAEAADSADPSVFVDEMLSVTNDGTECEDFASCKDLLADGEDINYAGASGSVQLDDVGDPTSATYAIGRFENGELTIIGSQLTEVEI